MNLWERLHALPRVNPWNKGKPSYTWLQRREDYSALPKAPIIITAELVTPILHAENNRTHLDSILSTAALTNHPVASAFDAHCVVPLPLELVWVSEDGLPLWACSPLMPASEGLSTREYWHKRYPSHRAEFGDKLNAITSAGRWKEYRIPVHAQSIDRLHALTIGNAKEIESLLSVVTHIGKKGSMGYGRVARWSVTPAEHSTNDVLALRPVPIAYFDNKPITGVVSPNRGWTPPYWYSPLWADCVVAPERIV